MITLVARIGSLWLLAIRVFLVVVLGYFLHVEIGGAGLIDELFGADALHSFV